MFSIITPTILARFLCSLYFLYQWKQEYTLQYAYLMAWWRHCVTSNVINVYFIEFKMNIGRLQVCSGKNTHFCFDYNTGVSRPIFIPFCTRGNSSDYYIEVNKPYNITLTVSPHSTTLSTQKQHILKRPLQTASCSAFDRTMQLLATFTESCLMFNFFYIFFKQIVEILYQSSGRKCFAFS